MCAGAACVLGCVQGTSRLAEPARPFRSTRHASPLTICRRTAACPCPAVMMCPFERSWHECTGAHCTRTAMPWPPIQSAPPSQIRLSGSCVLATHLPCSKAQNASERLPPGALYCFGSTCILCVASTACALLLSSSFRAYLYKRSAAAGAGYGSPALPAPPALAAAPATAPDWRVAPTLHPSALTASALPVLHALTSHALVCRPVFFSVGVCFDITTLCCPSSVYSSVQLLALRSCRMWHMQFWDVINLSPASCNAAR